MSLPVGRFLENVLDKRRVGEAGRTRRPVPPYVVLTRIERSSTSLEVRRHKLIHISPVGGIPTRYAGEVLMIDEVGYCYSTSQSSIFLLKSDM